MENGVLLSDIAASAEAGTQLCPPMRFTSSPHGKIEKINSVENELPHVCRRMLFRNPDRKLRSIVAIRDLKSRESPL